MGWSTLCGLALREKEKAVIRKFIKKNDLNQISNMVELGESSFYVKGLPHSFGSVRGKLAVCYNASRRVEICNRRRSRILEAQRN